MQTVEQRAADLRKCNLSNTEALAQARQELTVTTRVPLNSIKRVLHNRSTLLVMAIFNKTS